MTHSSHLIAQLLNPPEVASSSSPATSLNLETAHNFLFDELFHLLSASPLRLSGNHRKQLLQFIGELAASLLQRCPVSTDNQTLDNQLLILVEAFINSKLVGKLCTNV